MKLLNLIDRIDFYREVEMFPMITSFRYALSDAGLEYDVIDWDWFAVDITSIADINVICQAADHYKLNHKIDGTQIHISYNHA